MVYRLWKYQKQFPLQRKDKKNIGLLFHVVEEEMKPITSYSFPTYCVNINEESVEDQSVSSDIIAENITIEAGMYTEEQFVTEDDEEPDIRELAKGN